MAEETIHERSVFVKIDDYKEAISLFNNLKMQLQKTKTTLDKIKELKKEEQIEIELWDNSVNEIEKKLKFIEQNMVETQG